MENSFVCRLVFETLKSVTIIGQEQLKIALKVGGFSLGSGFFFRSE